MKKNYQKLFFAVSVTIQFTYPPTYPDEVPEVTVPANEGLSEQQVQQLETHLYSLVGMSEQQGGDKPPTFDLPSPPLILWEHTTSSQIHFDRTSF